MSFRQKRGGKEMPEGVAEAFRELDEGRGERPVAWPVLAARRGEGVLVSLLSWLLLLLFLFAAGVLLLGNVYLLLVIVGVR